MQPISIFPFRSAWRWSLLGEVALASVNGASTQSCRTNARAPGSRAHQRFAPIQQRNENKWRVNARVPCSLTNDATYAYSSATKSAFGYNPDARNSLLSRLGTRDRQGSQARTPGVSLTSTPSMNTPFGRLVERARTSAHCSTNGTMCSSVTQ